MARPAGWLDVIASDAGRSREFYGTLFGWQIDVVEDMDHPDGQRVGLWGP
jgi:uncharacterized protein